MIEKLNWDKNIFFINTITGGVESTSRNLNNNNYEEVAIMSKCIYTIQKSLDAAFNIKFVSQITDKEFRRRPPEAQLVALPAWNKGKTFSEETRKKMSESAKGKVISVETRKRISESHKALGRHLSEEHKGKISERHKGKVNSAETRKKMSEARKRYWAAK
jgi:conjugal transfer/entry exclusion protein